MNKFYLPKLLPLPRKYIRVFLMLLVVSLLGACRSGPPPKLYILDTLPKYIEQRSASNISVLGVSQIQLPGYASDTRLASIKPNGTISLDKNHKWADEPEQAITRLLIDRLRNHTGATVLPKPWPRESEPTVRVELVFDRLLRGPEGGAQMAGQILLISGNGRQLLRSVPFRIIRNGLSKKKHVFFTSVSQGIDDIAHMVANILLKSETPS